LRLEDRVVVGRVDRRLHYPDLAPVGVELLRHDERQSGGDALPHLGHRLLDGDRAVGRDRDVGVEPAGGALGLRVLAQSQSKGEGKAAAAAEEGAPADLELEQLEVVHG